jgi:hypothetical protein
VTSLLGRTIFKDKYNNVPKFVLDKAAERGTYIHQCCELIDDLGIKTECEEANNYVRICKENDLKVEASEYLISDNKHYASSIDKVFFDGESYHLADIKTTYTLDREFVMWQLSIYAYLFELQNKGAKVGKLFAIYLRKEKAEIVYVDRIDKKIIKQLMRADLEGKPFENPIKMDRPTLPEKYRQIENSISEIIEQRAYWDEKYNSLKEGIMKEMVLSGDYSWKGEKINITRRKESVSKRFDADSFKRDYPELYDKYLTETTRTGSLTINKI